MAAHKPEILISQTVYIITEKFHNSHISEVDEFKKAFSHTVWCMRKSEIQDGGFKR